SVSVLKSKNTVRLDVGADFEKGFSLIENIAERILVKKFIQGIYQLAGRPINQAEIEKIINLIIPDTKARFIHRIHANAFRDRVKTFLPRIPITIDRADDAGLRIGLGWIQRSKNSGPEILGKEECLKYLNATVESLENDLCLKLKAFNKKAFLKFFLENYEISMWESEHWRRTSGAVLSLHQDKPATYKALAEKEFLLNGASLASRLLIEMGNCECAPEKAREVGKLEASRLMSQALMIAHLGGLSDGIRWDAVEPRLKITPLGDIHFNVEFFDKVMVPFAEKTNFERLEEEQQRYPKHFKPLEIRKSVEDAFEKDFIKAWEDEHKSTLDEMRLFLDCLEDRAIITKEPVFEARLSELCNLKSNKKSLPPEKVSEIVESIKSTPRPSWREVPQGFLDKDRQPWRFRRRLSVIRNPLIQINESDDPTFLVSPGLIRDGFNNNWVNFYHGSFPSQQAKSKRMKSWIGEANHKQRKIFNTKVADKVIELGWQAKSDINVTEILNKSTGDKNFGDVDVIAWNANSKRVLIIECKDLQFRKTAGEIAEQLSDFRGNVKEDGKPDLLKKHIDRIDYLTKHQANVAAYVGFSEKPLIEGHIVFKNPVPMKFAWSHLQKKVNLSIFNELEKNFKI
ncbi:MAG: hypothetical protein IH995_04495, partial [Proteobacteria bacterium]|nr:hypothetical protein [Pseudomonadota bacterium]